MKLANIVPMVFGLCLTACGTSDGQTDQLRKENVALKAENAALRAELERAKFPAATSPPGQAEARRWPSGATEAYIERCGRDMVSQGMATEKAPAYCRCVAGGLEREFTREEFAAMMKAQPNPNGSEVDRRLYRVLSACNQQLPR